MYRKYHFDNFNVVFMKAIRDDLLEHANVEEKSRAISNIVLIYLVIMYCMLLYLQDWQ